MPSNTFEIDIAKFAVNTLNEKGFCVIDGLFTKSQIRNALKDIKICADDEKFSSGKVGGGRTSREQEKQEVIADIRSDKIMWLEGTETDLQGITSIVSKMDSILWEFNKFLNQTYFINGRSKEDGGLLRILPADSDNYIDIAPLANRLLFFWCDRRNPHEVHPAYKTRYAITVWYMDEEERKRAKQECLDGVATVTGESVLKECQQKQKERDEVNQKMNDVATDAIASLSLDELQAISSLISGQSNADDILAGMGISPEIRTKLLKKLHNLGAES
ncbi:egl nine homolog 1-like isoform X2 [Ruditapes philippinarum]|uniref:egl nine homolog 1-like isoform X2 n=1 Tax=Ruditapes philippinarum TaxID=129788 RepID=UPI00295AE346|nr:egl nine homolog 1-like isoform X2 [Ruditapes philippinarum]